jgi:predicted metal-dependent hydrolase
VASLRAKPEFLRGIELFNSREFFECHEVLEAIWLPARGAERLFLQSLIHLAVGFYHHERDNPAGAEGQLRKGLRKLAGYLPQYAGVRTAELWRAAQDSLERIGRGERLATFPRIKLL